MKKMIRFCVVFVVLCVSVWGETRAADGHSIREAMLARRAPLAALKTAGKIGESTKGFLVVVAEAQLTEAESALLKAENADRMQVYQAIAKKHGANPAQVGQRRAVRLIERAKAGEWVQQADGTWQQKKAAEAAAKPMP